MTCTTHHHACECREAEFARIEAERDRLRGALREILRYLDSTGQSGDHHTTLGEACGMDACVLCLAESVARAALSPAEQPPSNPGAPDATGSGSPRAQGSGVSGAVTQDAMEGQASHYCERHGPESAVGELLSLLDSPHSEERDG